MSVERRVQSGFLGFGWAIRIVTLTLLATFPTVFAMVAWNGEGQDRALGIGMFIGSTVMAVIAIAFVFRPQWRVDERGIERRMFLRKRDFRAWSDVTLITGNGLQFVVSGASGTPFIIGRLLTGLDVFAYLVLEFVPAENVSLDMTRRELAYCARRLRPIVPHVLSPEPIEQDTTSRWRENPFFVLGLSPDCSRADVERAGQKLLALLAVQSSAARTYTTPLGAGERTVDLVRAAMAELRDPERRTVHELWARTTSIPDDGEASEPQATAPWNEALAAIGWRRG